ncbi:hypothetical protein DH2020_044172 [Rehmannia glutinosa]|uniref:RNase H type-1 domain-containing protein n=1 Tax=Rehmannia glutinosa TaxID=99300 RepID=A0ABR0UIG6_REHGL
MGTFASWINGEDECFTWQSILAGKEIIQKGIQWIIGNGPTIWVWHDPWIAENYGFKVQQQQGDFPNNMCVNDLLDMDSHKWDERLVREIFNNEEVEKIFRILIRRCWVPDRLAWHYTTHGSYSSKTGYHVALSMTDELWHTPSHSGAADRAHDAIHQHGKWRKPVTGAIKINIDASVVQIEGTGLGVVFRDHNGEIQRVVGKRYHHIYSVEIAKKANVVAHLVVRFALSSECHDSYWGDPPTHVRDIAFLEALASD